MLDTTGISKRFVGIDKHSAERHRAWFHHRPRSVLVLGESDLELLAVESSNDSSASATASSFAEPVSSTVDVEAVGAGSVAVVLWESGSVFDCAELADCA